MVAQMSELEAQVLYTPPVDLSSPEIHRGMMAQLLTGEPDSVSYNEIVPGLDLGRASDTVNAGYKLVVCATNSARELHASLRAPGIELVQLPILVNGVDVSDDIAQHPKADVSPDSFPYDGQRPLMRAIGRIDAVLQQGGRVLVCCQQGKDRSALVVLAYLRAKFDVPRERVQNLYNFVQSRRYIVSAHDIPQYWSFLRDELNVRLARKMLLPGETAEEAVARLRSSLGGDACVVCILGGTRFQETDSEALVQAIARRLGAAAGSRVKFVTGGMAGVQETFAKHCGDGSRVWNLLPLGQSSGFGRGKDIIAGADLEERKIIFGLLGDVYITVEGGPGVAQEARAAHERGAVVLPLMRTGGASNGMFGFPEGALDRPRFVTEKQWFLLGSKGSLVDESAAAAAAALETYVDISAAQDPARFPEVSPRLEEVSQAIAGLRCRLVSALHLKGGPGLQDLNSAGSGGELSQRLGSIRSSLLEAHRQKRPDGEDQTCHREDGVQQNGWAEKLAAAEARCQEEKMRADALERHIASLEIAPESPPSSDRNVDGLASNTEEHVQQIAQLEKLARELQDVTNRQQNEITKYEQTIIEYQARERSYQAQVGQLDAEIRAAAAAPASPTSPGTGERLRKMLAETEAQTMAERQRADELQVQCQTLQQAVAEMENYVNQFQDTSAGDRQRIAELEGALGATQEASAGDQQRIVELEQALLATQAAQDGSAGGGQRMMELEQALFQMQDAAAADGQRMAELEQALVEMQDASVGDRQRIMELEQALGAAQDLAVQAEQSQLDARIGQMADIAATQGQIAEAEQTAAAYRTRTQELDEAITEMQMQASGDAQAAEDARQEAFDERQRNMDLERKLAELRDAEKDYLSQIATLQIAAKADAAGGQAEKQRVTQLELRCGRLEARLVEEQQAAKAAQESEAAHVQQVAALQAQLQQAEEIVQDSKDRLFEFQAAAETAQGLAASGEQARADMEAELASLRVAKQEMAIATAESAQQDMELQNLLKVISDREARIEQLENLLKAGRLQGGSAEYTSPQKEITPKSRAVSGVVEITSNRTSAPTEPLSVPAVLAVHQPVVAGRTHAGIPSISVVPASGAAVTSAPSASYVTAGGSFVSAAPTTTVTRKPISPITTALPVAASVSLAPPVSPQAAMYAGLQPAPISPTAVISSAASAASISPGKPISPGVPRSPTAIVAGGTMVAQTTAVVSAGGGQPVSPPTVVTQGIPKLFTRPGPQARGGSVSLTQALGQPAVPEQTVRMVSPGQGGVTMAAPMAMATAPSIAPAPLAPNLRPGF